MLYLADGERLVVIGSNAGNERAPAWALNLKAHPDADVQVRGAHRKVRARVAEGDERDRLWRRMNDQPTFRASRGLFAPPVFGVFGGGDRE